MNNQANKDIRDALRIADIKHWKLAEYLNISENTLSRKMRTEMSAEEKEKILNIIEQYKIN